MVEIKVPVPIEERITELEQSTAHVITNLENATYEELLSFTEERGKLVHSIVDELSRLSVQDRSKWKTILNGIVEKDAVITNRMETLKEEALKHISKVQQGKRSRTAYGTAYAAEEGFFVDKKR